MSRRPLLLVAMLLLLPALTAEAREEWMFDPTFRPGSGGDVLVAASPPLLRAQLDAFVDLTEAAFDLSVPLGLEQELRDALELRYGKAPAEERQAFHDLVAPCAHLKAAARAGSRETVEEGLSAFRRVIDAQLAQRPGWRSSEILRELLTLRQAVAWPGTPPAHAVAAEAWLELTELVVSLGRGEDYDPTPGQRTALRRDLAQVFHGKDEATRRRLREMHRLWLRTKGAWDGADTSKRLGLRWEAVALLAKLLPPGRQLAVETEGDLQAYASAAAQLARAEPAFDAWTNVAANPEVVLALVDRWLGPLPAERDDPLLYR